MLDDLYKSNQAPAKCKQFISTKMMGQINSETIQPQHIPNRILPYNFI